MGYRMAGFHELLAIDWEDHAVECFRKNFPEVPVWQKSILDVSGKEIMAFCKLDSGDLDVFDGSPPCQGFSTAGSRKLNDPRNDLFLAYFKLIDEIQPKVFVMENVSGMVKGEMKGKFIQILEKLRSTNYIVTCKLMNSMFYGVPQSRQRLIFIGVRKDLGLQPVFPSPSKKIITAGEAIGDLPNGIAGMGVYGQTLWGRCAMGKQLSSVHPKGHWFNSMKLHPGKTAPTVTKVVMPSGGGGLFHWKVARVLTILELKRVCSFPDDWYLGDDFKKAWARLGNAVMPKMMEAIALTIKKEMLGVY